MIKYWLRTVEACDRIVTLEAGWVVADESYRELRDGSAMFRRPVAPTELAGRAAAK